MRLFYFIALLFFLGCGEDPKPTPVPTPTPIVDDPLPDQVTYQEHVLPLFKVKCQACHNASTPDRNWSVYEIAYSKRAVIKLRIENRTMPIGLTITEGQRQLIIKWVDQGAKK